MRYQVRFVPVVVVAVAALAFALSRATFAPAIAEEPRGAVGRFASPEGALAPTATLDTFTGVIYVCQGEAGAGQHWTLDLPNGRVTERALAKDVTGGTMVLPAMPSTPGAGAPVYAWHRVQDRDYAIVDTRNGIVWLLVGSLGGGDVWRHDCRLATHSKRELHVAKVGK